MKRANTKVGDVFLVKLNNKTKYFQYITNDRTQLNSDVIRAFKKEYPNDAEPDLLDVVRDEVDFYAHCVVKLGLKMGLWERKGNIQDLADISAITFRSAADYAQKAGEEPVKISAKWYIWNVNDKDFTHIGKLTGEYKSASIGLIVNPYDIVNRIWKGKYLFEYPD